LIHFYKRLPAESSEGVGLLELKARMCELLGAGSGSNPLEQFVLLAKNARGAAAVELIKQALEAPGVFVFGELLDQGNVQELQNGPHSAYLALLNIYAYGTYRSVIDSADPLPELSPAMTRKIRLLTVVSLAEQNKILPYSLLMEELGISTVRELEDLVIEGISAGVVLGKLDQKKSSFEVDFVIGRDIRAADIGNMVAVLSAWCENCDSVLANIETQQERVCREKTEAANHKSGLDQKIGEVKQQLKSQPSVEEGDADSRMETERMVDRRDKKAAKGKGLRGSGKSGGSSSFWKQ